MTAATSSLTDQLDPDTVETMVRSTLASLPIDPGASEEDVAARRRAAVRALIALRPRDPIEAMLAARIVSAHNAAMECFRRAALPDAPDNVALRLQQKAIALANFAMRTQRELQKCQAAPPAYPLQAEQAAIDDPQPTSATVTEPSSTRTETVPPLARPDTPHVPIPPDAARLPPVAPEAVPLAA